MNINTKVKMKSIKHQEPMINRKPRLPRAIEEEKPGAYLSEKEKFLKKNKDNMIDREVVKDGKRRD